MSHREKRTLAERCGITSIAATRGDSKVAVGSTMTAIHVKPRSTRTGVVGAVLNGAGRLRSHRGHCGQLCPFDFWSDVACGVVQHAACLTGA